MGIMGVVINIALKIYFMLSQFLDASVAVYGCRSEFSAVNIYD